MQVVGDDDQSIYRFRGANVENILGFEEDYPEARKIVLDRNYRSTENILNAANAVIANNSHRMEKKLWSDKGDGEKLTAYTAQDEKMREDLLPGNNKEEKKRRTLFGLRCSVQNKCPVKSDRNGAYVGKYTL